MLRQIWAIIPVRAPWGTERKGSGDSQWGEDGIVILTCQHSLWFILLLLFCCSLTVWDKYLMSQFEPTYLYSVKVNLLVSFAGLKYKQQKLHDMLTCCQQMKKKNNLKPKTVICNIWFTSFFCTQKHGIVSEFRVSFNIWHFCINCNLSARVIGCICHHKQDKKPAARLRVRAGGEWCWIGHQNWSQVSRKQNRNITTETKRPKRMLRKLDRSENTAGLVQNISWLLFLVLLLGLKGVHIYDSGV